MVLAHPRLVWELFLCARIEVVAISYLLSRKNCKKNAPGNGGNEGFYLTVGFLAENLIPHILAEIFTLPYRR